MATVGQLNALNIGERFSITVDGKLFEGKLNSVNHLKSGPTSISIGDRPWRLDWSYS